MEADFNTMDVGQAHDVGLISGVALIKAEAESLGLWRNRRLRRQIGRRLQPGKMSGGTANLLRQGKGADAMSFDPLSSQGITKALSNDIRAARVIWDHFTGD